MEYTTRKANVHGCSGDMQMEGLPIRTYITSHVTDEGGGLLLLYNEGINHTSQKGSIMSVT